MNRFGEIAGAPSARCPDATCLGTAAVNMAVPMVQHTEVSAGSLIGCI